MRLLIGVGRLQTCLHFINGSVAFTRDVPTIWNWNGYRDVLQCETGTVIGTSLQYETVTAIETSVQCESVTVIETSFQYESVTAIETCLKYESVTVVETSLQFSLVCRKASLHLKVRRLQRSVLTGNVVFNKKNKVYLQLEVWRLTCGSVTFPKASLQMEVWRLHAALSRFQKHLYRWKRDVYMWQRHVSKGISTGGSVTFASASLPWKCDVFTSASPPQVEEWRSQKHLLPMDVCFCKSHRCAWNGDVYKTKQKSRQVDLWRFETHDVRRKCDVFKEAPSLYFCTNGICMIVTTVTRMAGGILVLKK